MGGGAESAGSCSRGLEAGGAGRRAGGLHVPACPAGGEGAVAGEGRAVPEGAGGGGGGGGSGDVGAGGSPRRGAEGAERSHG